MVTAREVHETLDERPDLEPAVEAALDAPEPFEFQDLPVDSSTFGELVSREIVVETDGGYRVADREAVRRGLAGAVDPGDVETTTRRLDLPAVEVPEIDRRTVAVLGGTLAFVVALRVISFPSVFRDGAVVLSGNDAYLYRYWVETLLVSPDASLESLPEGAATGEPLLVASLWLASELVGGTADAAGQVLAWYPIVSAAVVGLLTYALAVLVTDDRRIGIAAVLLLAVVPGFALRTSLGFADHHAFDYPWLVLTALSLTVVAREQALSWRSGLAAVGVGVGVAGGTLAWDASPLLLVALGIYLAADALVAVSNGRSPLATGGPVLAGVAGAAAVVWVTHVTLDWHTDLVASAPALLLVGCVGVVAAGELGGRIGVPAEGLAGVEAVGAVGGLVALAVLAPEYWRRLERGVTERLLRGDAIAETDALFGDSWGWLLLFGLVLVLALPYMAWGTDRAADEPRWLPAAVYGWYFFALAALQVRFVGELAAFAAVFAGFGFVHLAERVDVARPPSPFTGDRIASFALPDGRHLGVLVVLFLLVGGLGMLQVPVKVSQVTVSAERHATAEWMADAAADRGWAYPENYVFSPWAENRHYNYVVSGDSRSYAFAGSNYADFALSANGSAWHERLRHRAGFVVTSPGTPVRQGTLGSRLHRAYGSRTVDAPALTHYRAVYASESGDYKVFTLVPGAVIEGSVEPNATLTVSASVTVEGASFEYVSRARVDADGNVAVRVPYPGEYSVGDRTVTVEDSDVRYGETVSVG